MIKLAILIYSLYPVLVQVSYVVYWEDRRSSFQMLEDDINELLRIIDNKLLTPLYQPIVDIVDGEISGYEALIRGPSDSPLHSPLNLFDVAAKAQKISELEKQCGQISIKQFSRLSLPGKLFLNVSPNALLEHACSRDSTLEFLKSTGLSAGQVVIEISEQYPMENYDLLNAAIRHYNEVGFEIAIDDLGSGYAGLRSWSELKPDYVKIDRHFITNIDKDVNKQEFVHSIIDIAASMKCKIVAEGVETRDELLTVSKMGIQYIQGYYLSRPEAIPPQQIPSEKLNIADGVAFHKVRRPSKTIGSLTQEKDCISPDTRTEVIIDRLNKEPELSSIAVVSDHEPVGIVHRQAMLEVFSSRYGRDLHSRKPISEFMVKPLVFESNEAIENVSLALTSNLELDIAQDFIIVKDEKYLGVCHVRDLLKAITELQIKNARYSNPLTGLPGNVPIYEVIDQYLADYEDFHVAYCDLDHFKPYNDVYGYSRGDNILQAVAELFSAHIDQQIDFVGHVGGDDFVIVFRSKDWRLRCEKILTALSSLAASYYNSEDIEQGGINAYDRKGNKTFFPLLSLSIGVVYPDPIRVLSHHAVASLATAAKHEAKKIEGNSIFESRRRGLDPQK